MLCISEFISHHDYSHVPSPPFSAFIPITISFSGSNSCLAVSGPAAALVIWTMLPWIHNNIMSLFFSLVWKIWCALISPTYPKNSYCLFRYGLQSFHNCHILCEKSHFVDKGYEIINQLFYDKRPRVIKSVTPPDFH